MRNFEEVCKKCNKKYLVEVIRFPAKLEEGRHYDTFYSCPYCGDSVNITIGPDEDVRTKKFNDTKEEK